MAAPETEIEKAGREKVPRSVAGKNSSAASAVPDCSRPGAGLGKGALGMTWSCAGARVVPTRSSIIAEIGGKLLNRVMCSRGLRLETSRAPFRGRESICNHRGLQNYYWKNGMLCANLS